MQIKFDNASCEHRQSDEEHLDSPVRGAHEECYGEECCENDGFFPRFCICSQSEKNECRQQVKNRETVMDDVSIEDLTGFLCCTHRKEHDGGFPQCCIPAVAQGPEEKDQNRGIKDDEQAHPGAKGCHADSE